ncbi:MAG: anti-sigma factor, partial [Anaerolineae bacterium]|nr:anti-sigma factor [Anaerolineae bacterium]
MSSLLEDHNAVLALIGAGKAQRVDLRQVQGGNAEAMMLCGAQENIGFVYGENFSTLASGDTYQVWLVRENGVRVQGGVLQINNHGDGTLIIQLSEPFANFESVEITRQSISSTSQSSSVLVMQGTLHY